MIARNALTAGLVAVLVVAGCGGVDESNDAASATESTSVADGDGAGSGVDTADSGAASGNADEEPALFDSSVVHGVHMSYDQADYDAMIETLAETGDKEWIDVTVTLDGVTYEHAGSAVEGQLVLGRSVRCGTGRRVPGRSRRRGAGRWW